MSIRKSIGGNLDKNDSDEEEHERLLNEQDKKDKELMQDIPEINDEEYSRLIKINESLSRNDANMDGQDVEEYNEEEKEYRENRSNTDLDNLHLDWENELDNEEQKEKSTPKQKFNFVGSTNPFKKQTTQSTSYMRRLDSTNDFGSPAIYRTPQKYSIASKYAQNKDSTSESFALKEREMEEDFRKEIIKNVRIRVEELQSKMKSKSDMYYVLRHMCNFN